LGLCFFPIISGGNIAEEGGVRLSLAGRARAAAPFCHIHGGGGGGGGDWEKTQVRNVQPFKMLHSLDF